LRLRQLIGQKKRGRGLGATSEEGTFALESTNAKACQFATLCLAESMKN